VLVVAILVAMPVEQASEAALAAEMHVSLRARIAVLAALVAVAAAAAVGPCHMWGVVRASTFKKLHTSMSDVVATSTLFAPEETSHASLRLAAC